MLAEVSTSTISLGLPARSRGSSAWGLSMIHSKAAIRTIRTNEGNVARPSRQRLMSTSASNTAPIAAIRRGLQGGL